MMFAAWIVTAGCLLMVAGAVRRHLDPTKVARALQLLEDGERVRVVARRFDVSRSVVSRLWTLYQETGQYTRRQGLGRLRMTTQRQDRYLVMLSDRMSTSRSLEIYFCRATQVHLSNQTVRNRPHEDGMRARRPATGPILTAQHRRARLDFVREHQNRRLHHWIANESRFSVSTNADCNIVEVDRYSRGPVMVWVGVSLYGRTDLYVFARGGITAVRYHNDILKPIVRPYAGGVGDDFILVQDNAHPHTARVSMTFVEDEGITVMDWPARSSDLNPIEHLWDMLSRRVRRRPHPPENVQNLTNALVQEWQAIPQNDIRRIIRSMPRRCQECVNARGGHTSY